jgi:hypothetical protein
MPVWNRAKIGGDAIRGQSTGNRERIAGGRNLLAIVPKAQVVVEV